MVVVGHTGKNTRCQTIAEPQSCGACRACSIGQQNHTTNAENTSADTVIISLPGELVASNLQQISIGDRLEVAASVRMLLTLSLLVYLLPVVLMLLFTVCCSLLYPTSELFVALSAVAGLAIGLALVGWSAATFAGRIAGNLQVHRSL